MDLLGGSGDWISGGGASATLDIVSRLGGAAARERTAAPPWLILEISGQAERMQSYHRLRRREFVELQGLFAHHDCDDHDHDPSTRVLAAMSVDGRLLGGVRIHPVADGAERIGWWQGSRLVVHADVGIDAAEGSERSRGRIGAALVQAACAHALDVGALRFDAHVQERQVPFFERLGWQAIRPVTLAREPHRMMRWPIGRFAQLADGFKAPLGDLVGELLTRDRWRGDDGVPVGGSETIACVDAITPSMVERDPEWAGWCGMLVTAHDLAAMGAAPVGVLDTLAAPDAAHASRVIDGIRAGSGALSLPVLGGHTQLGAPAALSVTGLGRTSDPVPAGGGRVGDAVTLVADVAGGWRPGYAGAQWDSSSWRTGEELARMLSVVARTRPHAAKDVSMAGVVGTLGMLAEASGCGAELEVAAAPRPESASLADWLTCFPGFAMLTCDAPGRSVQDAGPALAAACGTLTSRPGVRLRWPDGELTEALPAGVTGLGAAPTTEDTTNPETSR